MTNHKPIALWSVPRSMSTAFERVFIERGDFEVFHEPFSASYYYSTERRSDRFASEEPRAEYRYDKVLAEILTPGTMPVFIKDMAYHVTGFVTQELITKFRNTFIVREPQSVLASLYKMWPDFTFEEAGYEELHQLFVYVLEEGQEPVVVDALDLSENPERVVAAYCEALNIPFVPEALSWEPREVSEWKMWDAWHENAQKSTGISRFSRSKKVTLPEELEEVYHRCLPYYEALHAERLRV